MGALTHEQRAPIVARFRADGRAALEQVTSERDEGRSSLVQAGLSLFDLDSSSQLDAQVGDVRMWLQRVDVLERLEEDDEDAADLARNLAKDLKDTLGYAGTATLSWVIEQTAEKTGERVKEGVNQVASAAARFAWSAIPWWALVGGAAFVAWRLGLFRRTA